MTENQSKLQVLRTAIVEHGVQGYLIPRADEFQGEFVAPYAERLKWLTGFTGSGGMAVVLADKAFLLTDGRYTLQAEQQVDTSLFTVGDYVQKPAADWLAENTGQGDVIGYDPWLFTPSQIEKFKKKNISLRPLPQNLIDQIWGGQPDRPLGSVAQFPDKIAGITSLNKRKKLADEIKEQGDAFLFALPDSIAWLLNVRGADIDYIPSVLSYALLDKDGALTWFVDPQKIPNDFECDAEICAPQDMETKLQAFSGTILMDFRHTPIAFKDMCKVVKDAKDPTITPKACKTSAEQDAIRKAHIEDGVALVKFLKWIDDEAPKGNLTEIRVTEKLLEFRKEGENFKDDSFPTIAGFGPNGAIIHYRATPQTDRALEPGSLLLVDSGGQYAGDDTYGTTDITRTIAIGEPSTEMRENFTRVLKGHIGLASAKFPRGTVGAQIDTLARKPLWDAGLDYAHGTGHGVGCYLAVHEDAANISSRGQTPFEPGMLISNEPGYYKEGEYGIRIENLVLVTENDNQLAFNTISYAPIEQSPIVEDMLTLEEKDWLTTYHAEVYEKLSPLLDDAHKNWLKSKVS